jgi:hypothetical protein
VIDVHLLVYPGTLAVFVICIFAIGVLSAIDFTSLAAIAGIALAHRNQQTRRNQQIRRGHANSLGPDALDDQAACEIRAQAADGLPWTEDGRALDPVPIWRLAKPRIIQHIETRACRGTPWPEGRRALTIG